MLTKKYTSLLLALLCSNALVSGASADAGDDIFSLSLAELVNLEVTTGSLFGGSAKDSPSAITIISNEQIELSGAKNLSTLMEQHVPGMILMTHSEGEKIGLRGHIAAENYKLLLLVNGKNVTNMVYEGVITEIDQWELGDIERVEVVSGPGSVTYGTGAIAGVINIITKTSKTAGQGWSVGVASHDTYNSEGLNIQYSGNIDDWGVYGFVSYRETDGLKDPDYFRLNPNEPSDNRYVGKGLSYNLGPQEYLADSFDRPQIKAHLGVERGDNFSAWLRYTQSGQTHAFQPKNYAVDDLGNPIAEKNYRNISTRSFIASADYQHKLSDSSSLATSITFDSQEYLRHRAVNTQYASDNDNNIRQYAFSQDRLALSALFDVRPTDRLNIITGYEYSQIRVGAPWGKGDDHLWIKEGVDILSSLEDSAYLQDLSLNGRPNTTTAVEVGSGIRLDTHSHLLESKYSLSEQHELFYAHRIDLPDLSDAMFSPRLSLLSKYGKDNTLVSTVQRAQRMMPIRAQYLSDISGDGSKHETIDSLELSFTNTGFDNATINVRAYYNEVSAVGFTGLELKFLADYELFGLDFTATYKADNVELSFNHSFIDPLNVSMNDNLKTGGNRNNISFSDYYYSTSGAVPLLLEGYGDGLNNWPTNISKFLYTHSFLGDRLKAHVNLQIYWDYEGAYDEMGMYQTAYDNIDRASLSSDDQLAFDQQYQDFLNEKRLLENEGAYDIDYNVNASLTYVMPVNSTTQVKLKLFAENLFNSSRRYYVSTGSSGSIPTRLQYLDKPEMYGVSVQLDFK